MSFFPTRNTETCCCNHYFFSARWRHDVYLVYANTKSQSITLCHCRLLLFSRRRTRFAQLATTHAIVQDSPTDPPFETTARFTLRTLFHIPPFAIIPRVILGSHMSANRRLSSLEIISRRVFSASSFRPGFIPPFSQYIRRGRGEGRSPPSLLAFFSRSAIEDRFPREKRKESSVARSCNRPRLRGTLIRVRGKTVGNSWEKSKTDVIARRAIFLKRGI